MESKGIDERFEEIFRQELRELMIKMFGNGATVKTLQPLIARGQFTPKEVEEIQLKAGVELGKPSKQLIIPPRNPNRRPTNINMDRSIARMRAEHREVIRRVMTYL